MNKSYFKISLIFLFIVAAIGCLLRAVSYVPISFDYVNFLHAHSHVAFQGWIYSLQIILLPKLFLKPDQILKSKYPTQLKLTFFVLIGILVSFTYQGYGVYSIFASTLFQILNYWFFYCFWKDLKTDIHPKRLSVLLVKTGLVIGFISTLLPFIIAFLTVKGFKGTELYFSILYSFLHLQYNGWFLFIAFAIVFRHLENKGVVYSFKSAYRFFYFFSLSVIPAIVLSLLGMSFRSHIIWIAILAASLQVVAVYYIIQLINIKVFWWFRALKKWSKIFFFSFFISFIIKNILQFYSIFPFFEDLAFGNRFVILAYLHLNFIGILSMIQLALLYELGWFSHRPISHFANSLFMIGYISTETILALTGLGIFSHPLLLLIGSLFMFLAVIIWLFTPTTLNKLNTD